METREGIQGDTNCVTKDTRECLDPSRNSSENVEELPRKILKEPRRSCKAVHVTKLHAAVRKNDITSVRAILMRNQSLINEENRFGLSALHIAAKSGHKEIVQMLLTAGANTRVKNSNRRDTPLHLALRWKKADVAEVLVDWDASGTPNDLQNKNGQTPLNFAALRGYTNIVKKLVGAGVNTCLSDLAGMTPLHVAIDNNNEDTAKALIDWGAVNDFQNKEGRSPLHLAALEGCVDVCQKLLAAGCSTRLQDKNGASPLHLALEKFMYDVSDVLVDYDPVNNLQDINGMTPLHWASYVGCSRTVQRLLSTCVNRHLRDKEDCTPLHTALLEMNVHIAEILIDAGAMDEISPQYYKPLLNLATTNKWTNVVRKLLFYDVHPHSKDDDGIYPLEDALTYRNKEMARMILSACSLNGVEINWNELELKPKEIQYGIKLLSKYDSETKRMKNTLIPGTTVSYYDIAKGNVCTLTRYLDNEIIQKVLSRDNAMKKFKNYAELIAFKKITAESRKIWTDRFLGYFVLLFGKLCPLPRLVIDIILLYLSVLDMQNFIEAFKLTP